MRIFSQLITCLPPTGPFDIQRLIFSPESPNFHEGSAKTLADVVRFYNEGGRQNINREWELDALALADDEQRDLVAFLESLTGKMPNTDDLLSEIFKSTISGK